MIQSRRSFVRMLAFGVPALAAGIGLSNEKGRRTGTNATATVSVPEEMEFVPRSMWAVHTPDTSTLIREHVFNRITVHHQGADIQTETALDRVGQAIRNIADGHMKHGYEDIGYHFVIDFVGRIWEGRSLGYRGVHVSGENDGNIGIVTLGNFEMQQPSGAQSTAVSVFVRQLAAIHGVAGKDVYGHSDLGATLCPGKNLYPVVAHVRDSVGKGAL